MRSQGFGLKEIAEVHRQYVWGAMHCDLNGISICTSSFFRPDGSEIKSICQMQVHFNNCPTEIATHPACFWKENFPKCEKKVTFNAPVQSVRGFVHGRNSQTRLKGLLVKLNDGSELKLGKTEGRSTNWEANEKRITGLEFVH